MSVLELGHTVGPLRQWRDLWLQTCSSETVMQKGVIAVPFGGAWKSMGQICKLAKVVELRNVQVHTVDYHYYFFQPRRWWFNSAWLAGCHSFDHRR
jgi:hypothetical protein